MKLFFCSFLLIAALFAGSVRGQSVAAPPERPDLAYATAQYQQARLTQANLFNGIEHIRGYPNAVGHPYFGAGEWATGTIEYDHVTYPNVTLLFDLTMERVVVQHPDSVYRVALVPEKTGRFTFDGQTFINLRDEDARRAGLTSGFYQVLYNGPSDLLAHRTKIVRSEVSRNTINYWFEQHDQYFLHRGGTYHPVKGKSSLLKLAGPAKKNLVRHWREKKIRFRRNRELAYIEAARYFDTLKP